MLKNVVFCFVILLFSCGNKQQRVPHYTISKIFKTDSLTTVDVHINKRLSAHQLLLIAGKLKADSARINNLDIHYLLPGNADLSAGEHSYYADARYIKDTQMQAADTTKDENGNVFRINLYGLDTVRVSKLLSLQPKEIAGKKVMGRFIDDYNHTVIIPFIDPADNKGSLYIIELDSTAKVVSATMPLKINDAGVVKWQVTQNGDYLTIKDNVLTQYPADGLGVPFNSIKSGI